MKSRLIEKIRSDLRERLDRLARAAMEAHAAATDPSSKAESKYDTRNLEASYLASGQAKQVDELAEAFRVFEAWNPPDYEMTETIDSGALVEVEMADETCYFLLAPAAGGTVVEHEGMEITLLTPASALYQTLQGMKMGGRSANPDLMITEVS